MIEGYGRFTRFTGPHGFIVTTSKASLVNGWEDNPSCPIEATARPHQHVVIPCDDGEMVVCLVGPAETTPEDMAGMLEKVIGAITKGL